MAKKFIFDDEELQDKTNDEQSTVTYIPENNGNDSANDLIENNTINDSNVELTEEPIEEKESLLKRVLHMKWRWWHYILLSFVVLCILFGIYIYSVTNADGPVNGNRCEGVVAIPVDAKTSTIETMKNKYEQIESLDIEVVCKQIKFDIVFKKGTKTKDATKITEKVILAFDEEAGIAKEEGQKYSQLFGSIDNEPQYDINICLVCDGNKDFPVYGTKHTQKDKISYTYASIKDQDSYDKAVSTLDE